MIFVTLGTQDKPFNRLLDAVQTQIDKGIIKDRVVVQAGCTKFKSNDMEVFDLIPMDDFSNYVEQCDILITHGGVGSIVEGLKRGKKVIAAPRLYKYREHINDHQTQIIENFNDEGYIIGIQDLEELENALERVKDFKPKKYKSNTLNMIELVENIIEKF